MPTTRTDTLHRVTIVPLERPAPADDMRNADDRAQAAAELAHWSAWPYEVEVETDDGTVNLYGHAARDWFLAWSATL